MKVPATKNREANELRAKAHALRAELLDATKEFTVDEVTKKTDAIRALDQRAQAAAEFTPEAEIERQGGDDIPGVQKTGADGTPVPSPTAGEDNAPITMKAQVEQLRKDILKQFGGEMGYLRALTGKFRMNERQVALVARAKALTQHLVPEAPDVQRTIVGTASDASGGEFLLPLQQEQSIFEVSNLQAGILERARRYAVTGRTLRIPYLVQTDGTAGKTRPMAGIANVTIVGEAGTKPSREPSFAQRLLTVYKWAAIAQIGDETIADDFTGDLQPAVTGAVGGQVMNAMNEYMTIDGTGTSQPLGALNTANGALMTVNRAASNKVGTADVFAMYSRHTMGPNSFWLCSRRVVEQLFALAIPAGSTGTSIVSYLPDLRGKPQLTLLGMPVVITDLLPTLGSTADLALINPDFYACAIRTQLTVESSIHVRFVDDVTTYRFFARGGGIPIPDAPYAYKSDGSATAAYTDQHSPFVALHS